MSIKEQLDVFEEKIGNSEMEEIKFNFARVKLLNWNITIILDGEQLENYQEIRENNWPIAWIYINVWEEYE